MTGTQVSEFVITVSLRMILTTPDNITTIILVKAQHRTFLTRSVCRAAAVLMQHIVPAGKLLLQQNAAMCEFALSWDAAPSSMMMQ